MENKEHVYKAGDIVNIYGGFDLWYGDGKVADMNGRRTKGEKLRLQKNAEKEARRIHKKDLAEYERIKKKYNLD